MANPINNRSYYPALDGLRGLAILLVLVHHNFDFIPFMQFGWIGVDLFLVLSGFLITEILLVTRDRPGYLQNFYIKRLLRIFPLYYLAILLFFLVVPYCLRLANQYHYYQQHQVYLWTNTQNWLYILYQPPTDRPILSHFWSLSSEEQFYLCWPLLLVLIKKTKMITSLLLFLLMIGIAARLVSWILLGNGYTNFTFQERTRMDGLYLGCLIALWKYYRPTLFQKRMMLICAGIFCMHILSAAIIKLTGSAIPHFYIIGYSSIAAVFALLVCYGIKGTGILKQYFLESKPLKWLGKISYGLYVYHWPILVLFKIYLTAAVVSVGFTEHATYVLLSVSAAIIAIGVSWLSYTFFEKKILALKHHLD